MGIWQGITRTWRKASQTSRKKSSRHRNIYCTDTYSDTSLKNEAEKHNYRYIIYLTQGAFCWDTGVYEYAEVLDIKTGDLFELSIKDGKVIVSKK